MKAWHFYLGLSLFLASWSFSKGYRMTGGKLRPSSEMLFIASIFAVNSIRLKLKETTSRNFNKEFDDILDHTNEEKKS